MPEIKGKIIQVIGPVVDIEFEEGHLPEIYSAVKRIASLEGYSIVLDSEDGSIFYYTIDADITEKVIAFFEDRYGEKEETE